MKKSFFLAMIMAVSLAVFSCNESKVAASDVPQPVMAAFEAKYPGATDVEWKTEKNDGKMVYEAHFKMGTDEKEAEFDTNGGFIKEEE